MIVNDENPKWSETNIILEVFGGSKLKPLGKIILKIGVNKFEKVVTEFIIIKKNVKPILGLNSLIELKLLQNSSINSININNKEDIVSKNLSLFQGVGEFKVPLELHIQPGTQAVVKPPRRVPHAIRERLACKLQSLQEHRIIEKVEHPDRKSVV